MFKSPNRYFGESGIVSPKESQRFQELIEEAFYLSAASEPEDFLPIMRLLGVTKYKKKLMKLEKEIDELLQELVDERRSIIKRQTQKEKDQDEKKTVLDVMLSLQETEAEYYTDQLIKGMILVRSLTTFLFSTWNSPCLRIVIDSLSSPASHHSRDRDFCRNYGMGINSSSQPSGIVEEGPR